MDLRKTYGELGNEYCENSNENEKIEKKGTRIFDLFRERKGGALISLFSFNGTVSFPII